MALARIPEELVGFCESGISVLLGTRDATNRPACSRPVGAMVSPARDHVTVVVPSEAGARVLANLRENGLAAVTFVRPIDNRGMQVKGRCVAVRALSAEEQARTRAYLEAFAESLHQVGMPRPRTMRLTIEPAVAVDIAIEQIFQQTPGPSAGAPLQSTGSEAP
ncbi:MAG: pyridoxamine 5'-phosphate oxidase family protein [Myxococcales bacterium]|jgi:hypothetical protein|nr:pyridoxamine 5'-phosphate oxidase family protein [Myxococcales bacterium]